MTQPRFKGKYRIESIRLPNRDYAANGWHFVTICTQNRNHFFGDVIANQMQLSAIGKIAQQFWAEIPNHFAHTYIDAYIIMPNHVHGIVVIDRPPISSSIATTPVETLHCNVSTPPRCNVSTPSPVYTPQPYIETQRQFMSEISPKTGSLGCIIRSYKSAVTRWCHQNGFDDFGWQSRFYEHIIRADGSLDRIRQYIINNQLNGQKIVTIRQIYGCERKKRSPLLFSTLNWDFYIKTKPLFLEYRATFAAATSLTLIINSFIHIFFI